MRPLLLKGHERALTRVRINLEGDLIFTSAKDRTLCVWFTDNGERLGTYDGHEGAVWDIDVTWDTRLLLSSSGDCSVKLWDVATGRMLHSITNDVTTRSCAFSYSGNLAAYTRKKMHINLSALRVFDIRDPSHTRDSKDYSDSSVIFQTFETDAESCIFSELDNIITVGFGTGHLSQYDLRNPTRPIENIKHHAGAINDLQLSKDGNFLISSSADKTAKVFHARTLQLLKTFKSGRPVNSAAISPTRDHIILGGGEEAMNVTQTSTSSGQFEARIYHLIYEQEFAKFKGHFGPINTLVFHPEGDIVITGGEDGYIRIQELDEKYKTFEMDK
uniref:Eukaryotic translation initiation factor 3 subunit I n=1 Tax=Parastrongyloides trichosuri TaxID=131310 RepID=A0A0N4Z289_PARTI